MTTRIYSTPNLNIYVQGGKITHYCTRHNNKKISSQEAWSLEGPEIYNICLKIKGQRKEK